MTDGLVPYSVIVRGEQPTQGTFQELVAEFSGASIKSETDVPVEAAAVRYGIEVIGDEYDQSSFREKIAEFDGASVTSTGYDTESEQPINFPDIVESFELAMRAHEDIPDDAIGEVIATVEDACATNERQLMWQQDYSEFVAVLDGVLDSIDGNGYSEQVERLDSLREKLEPIHA